MKLLIYPALFLSCASVKHVSKPVFFEDQTANYIPADELKNNSMDVETADLDNDGDLDMVIAMEFRPNVLLLNDGTGKMINSSVGRLPQANYDSEDIAIGDFDKDGDPDIIFVAEDDQRHEYCLNDGKGVFTNANHRFSFPSTANAVDAADFDKDGDLDIVMGNAGQDFYLVNDGKGNFTNDTKNRMPADNTVTQDIQSADIDKDGDLDLVIGNEDGNRIYLNDGKGFFSNATNGRLPLENEETRKVDITDIDGDKDLDIFFSNVNFRKDRHPANRILVNDGKGFFSDETGQRFKGANDLHTADASFFDHDNDGDADIVLANIFGGYIQLLENNGKGVFTEITETTFGSRIPSEAISVEIIDLNGDKKMDIYFGMFRAPDRFFLNKNVK